MDGVESGYIKLTKDDMGQHHWLPLSLMADVDEVVSTGHEETKAQMVNEDPNV